MRLKFNPFGLVIMLGASILIVLGAIALSPRCEYAVGTVDAHISIGGMLIAGCPDARHE